MMVILFDVQSSDDRPRLPLTRVGDVTLVPREGEDHCPAHLAVVIDPACGGWITPYGRGDFERVVAFARYVQVEIGCRVRSSGGTQIAVDLNAMWESFAAGQPAGYIRPVTMPGPGRSR